MKIKNKKTLKYHLFSICRLIDCFEVDTPVSSLSMSPTGEFIATSHVDDIGIYLWSNKTLYEHVSLQALPDDFIPMLIENPSTCSKTHGKTFTSVSNLVTC